MAVKTLKSEAARQQWGEILDTARTGQEIVIERYNKPVAVLLGFQEYEKLMQVFPLMLDFIEGKDDAAELNSLLTQIIAHRRLQEYLADPSLGVPYEEFRLRMVAEGVLEAESRESAYKGKELETLRNRIRAFLDTLPND